MNKKHITLSQLTEMKKALRGAELHTVCEEALCPNIGECFSRGTATFLIMGDKCTRNCSFCAVKGGAPGSLDPDEPKRVAATVKKLGLKYAVITSVTRDDLADGGAQHFADTVERIREISPDSKIEVLVPDFKGDKDSAQKVFSAKPDVFNHNLETVPVLYSQVRPQADYRRSLELLLWAKEDGLKTKSGLMLGLGEKSEDVMELMKDLRAYECDFLTFGQYIAPTKKHYPVKEHISKAVFDEYKRKAIEMGFKNCASSAYVRSSYMAEEFIIL